MQVPSKGAERRTGHNLGSRLSKCRSGGVISAAIICSQKNPSCLWILWPLHAFLSWKGGVGITLEKNMVYLLVLIPIYPKGGAMDALTQNLVTTWRGQVPLRCWFCERSSTSPMNHIVRFYPKIFRWSLKYESMMCAKVRKWDGGLTWRLNCNMFKM